jgi:hypothetical protein
MAAYLSTAGQIVGSIFIVISFWGFGCADEFDDVAWPAAFLGLGVTALLGSSAAISALQGWAA